MEDGRSPSLTMRVLQRIVRNDAMKHDPPEIYGWRVFLLACSVSGEAGTTVGSRAGTDFGRLASAPCVSAGTPASSGASSSWSESLRVTRPPRPGRSDPLSAV